MTHWRNAHSRPRLHPALRRDALLPPEWWRFWSPDRSGFVGGCVAAMVALIGIFVLVLLVLRIIVDQQ